MSLDALVNTLAGKLDANLISVTLYGPAAKADGGETGEDNPLLIVVQTLDPDTYRNLAVAVKPWIAAGNSMPMIFTADRLAKSADSFPVELLDMKECRKVLYGVDSIVPLEVNRAHFQQELINNIKAEMLRLRTLFLQDFDNPAELKRDLLISFTSMNLFLRSTLRLFIPVCPSSYSGILESLRIHVPIDADVFETVRELRSGAADHESVDMNALYLKYIGEVEKIADGIDQLKIRRGGGATYPPFKG